MVRLMLVRHAHSVQNQYMEEVMSKLRSKEIEVQDFNKTMRNAPKGAKAFEDAKLSLVGRVQARKFAHTWVPLLSSKAAEGKLLVVVSPFVRTMDTADPFMSLMQDYVPGFKASINPLVMEIGAITTFEDMDHLDAVNDLLAEGDRQEALRYLKAVKWSPAGMTVEEISRKYPWASIDTEDSNYKFEGKSTYKYPESSPWWTTGYEAQKRAHGRMHELIDWINRCRQKVDDDTVVMVVTHGETIENVVNMLLHVSFTSSKSVNDRTLFTGIRNTSMTCFHLPSESYDFSRNRPTSTGDVVNYHTLLEFFNDTSHLGNEQLLSFAGTTLKSKL